jgi:hypothetical protein
MDWIVLTNDMDRACLMAIQPAVSARRRLKQCSILFAAARRWLVSVTTFLGTRLWNQKI